MAKIIFHYNGKILEVERSFGMQMRQLFELLSGAELPKEIPILKGFEDFYSVLYKRFGQEYKIKAEYTPKIADFEAKGKRAIVGFSSGLDSTFQALRLKDMGYDVILLHFKNLNKAYPDEFERAKNFAEKFGFNFAYVDIKVSKQEHRIDNIIKNQMILSMAIDLGSILGVKTYAMGNYTNDKIENCRAEFGLSDSIELFNAFNKGVGKYLKDYRQIGIDLKKKDVYEYVYRNHADAFLYVNSCINPHRFKDSLNRQNRDKYGVEIIPHHCGSCYKCAIEYINLMELGYYPMNEKYLKKCIDILRKSADKIYTDALIDKGMTDGEILDRILST